MPDILVNNKMQNSLKYLSPMGYNARMSDGKKISIWFGSEQLRRLEAAMNYIQKTHDRAQVGTVVKELMGYPVADGLKPLIDDTVKKIIASGIGDELAARKSRRPAS